MERKIKPAVLNSAKSLCKAFPILFGAVLLISLVSVVIPSDKLSLIFSKNLWVNTFIATGLGSILAGNPVTSYVLAGEFLSLGIGLLAVTSFLIAWVTVGVIQLPAEIMMLGKKFAIRRNLLSFIFSIIVALIIIAIFNIGGLI